MTGEVLLDNPVWHALTSRQRLLNRGTGSAARYPAEVSRFVGLEQPTREAFRDLSDVVQQDETVALVTSEPIRVAPGFEVLRSRHLAQMVCDRLAQPESRLDLPLEAKDVPEMLELARLTEPGPFLRKTIGMGRYFGIRSDNGRLVAMAGERMRLPGYNEISAVCTHPDFRGRGYARLLVAGIAALAFDEGCKPFLHVKTENGAKPLYEAIGFRMRRDMQLTVVASRRFPSATHENG